MKEQGMNDNRRGMILALAAPLMWGFMGLFVRNLLAEGFSNSDIAFIRCAIGGAGYLPVVLLTGRGALKTDIKGLLICIVSGVLCYSFSFVTYGIAVERIPIAAATVLMFMSPVWVALFSRIFFRRQLKRHDIASIVMCFAGAVLISNLLFQGSFRMDAVGLLAGVLNGMGMAAQIIVPEAVGKRCSRDAMLVYGLLGAAVFMAFFADLHGIAAIVAGGTSSAAGQPDMHAVLNILGIGVLCTLIANVAYVKSTEYISSVRTSIISSLEVVIAAAVAFAVFGETLLPLQVAGAVVIMAGTVGIESVRGLKNLR